MLLLSMTLLLMIIFAVVSDLPIDIILVSFLVFILKFLFASAVFRKQYIILSFPVFMSIIRSSTKAHSAHLLVVCFYTLFEPI